MATVDITQAAARRLIEKRHPSLHDIVEQLAGHELGAKRYPGPVEQFGAHELGAADARTEKRHPGLHDLVEELGARA
jgi:hypothetical protein